MKQSARRIDILYNSGSSFFQDIDETWESEFIKLPYQQSFWVEGDYSSET